MTDFFYRTEDISPTDVQKYFVETEPDRRVVDALKGRNPTIVVGSRGVGKSFLLRVAQQEMLQEFDAKRVLPVYLTFVKSSLLQTADPDQFRNWMLARICSAIIRGVKKQGLLLHLTESARVLAGRPAQSDADQSRMESIVEAYEDSWKTPGLSVNTNDLPSVDDVKFALEDLSEALRISRFAMLIDEGAHVFLPSQQRQFFTLFRDLRSHCVTCNAAVYPGVTSYGDTFQPSHDATMISLDRDIQSPDYLKSMREIVEKQADSTLMRRISQNGQNFAVLAYAATGNPRLLLKTAATAPDMNSAAVNDVVRQYYRSDIWSEHSALSEKYVGHKTVIDWGRDFLEHTVLPEIKQKNDSYLEESKQTSVYIWIHRDTPAAVKEGLRVLCYTGILTEQEDGIRATRSNLGKRYLVSLGCLFALEPAPAATAFKIASRLTPKRMTEYGENHAAYAPLANFEMASLDNAANSQLSTQLGRPTSVLDITEWQRSKLTELNLLTVGSVLHATEEQLKEAHYVGDVRARRMRNAAVAAVFEYLSG